MVDYELNSLFKKDGIDKQLIIQTEDKAVTITNTELHQEKFELTESLCSESELTFGSCEASSIKFTMSNVFTSLKDKWITVTMSLNGNTDKPFQFGRYKVYSDKPTADRTQRDVVAYDALYDIINANVMEWYDSVLPNLDSTITLKNFRDRFFEHFGVTQKDIALPNDSMVIKRSLDKETGNVQTNVLSGSTVIKAICEINGCFGHINRQGQFEYIYLKQDIQGLYPANDLYPADNVYPKSPDSYRINKSDYITADYEDYIVEPITKLQIRSSDSDVGTIIGNGNNAYIIENNMLTYQKTADEMQTIAQNIYNKISKIRYRPFTADLRGNPCLEVGDAIRILTKNAIVESYVLERDFKGIQALRDSFSSVGEQYYSEKVNSTQTSIKQLENRSNKLERTIEETKSTITDVENDLSSQIKQTADSISSEVSKKVGNDEIISKINQSAEAVMIEANKINLKGTIVVGDLAENSGIAKSGDIPTNNNQLVNGAGYQTSNDVTIITKNTVTTEFVNALNVKAGSVDAENITGTTISGKKITGAAGEFTQDFKVNVPFVISSLGNLSAIMKLGITNTGSSWGVVIPEEEEDPAFGNYAADISISKGTINVHAGSQLNLVGQGNVSIKSSYGTISIGDINDIVGALKGLVIWKSQKKDNLTQAAGTDDYWHFYDLCKIPGYTRTVVNVSISGTMSSFMNHYQTEARDDSVVIRTKNLSTTAFNGSIEARCLYIRDGFH